jgi:hypothetical protein
MASDAETQKPFIRQRVDLGDANQNPNTVTSSTETTTNELKDRDPVVVRSVGMSLAICASFLMFIYLGFTSILASE